MVHAFHQEAEAGKSEFEASLVYRSSSRMARETLSQKNEKKKLGSDWIYALFFKMPTF